MKMSSLQAYQVPWYSAWWVHAGGGCVFVPVLTKIDNGSFVFFVDL